jgi:hypothetical protein
MIEAKINGAEPLKHGINNLSAVPFDDVLIFERHDLTIVSKGNDGYTYEGVCARFGITNRNNRIYEKADYLSHLPYLLAKITKGGFMGELDHPKEYETSLKNASHIIESIWFDEADNSVRIKIKLLDTPSGRIAKVLADANVPLSISSRAAGQLVNEGSISRVKLHRIFSFDLVAEPGFEDAVLRPSLNENLKANYDKLYESLNAIKNDSIVNRLVSINENYNFDDNVKIYKINKDDESFNKVLADIKKTENNSNSMNENLVTKEDFGNYTKLIQEQLTAIKNELVATKDTSVILNEIKNKLKYIKESDDEEVQELGAPGAQETQAEEIQGAQGVQSQESQSQEEQTTELPNITEDDTQETITKKLVTYVNYLAGQMEAIVNHGNYVTEMLNKNIGYTENIGQYLNKNINFTNYMSEKLNQVINYADLLGTKTNQGINYSELIGEKLSNLINFSDVLSTKLNQTINYADYGFNKLDEHIDYTNYMSKLINNKTFTVGQTKGIADRDLTKNVETITESVNESESASITSKVDELLGAIKKNSNTSVLEGKYPFLKLMNESNKQKFYTLDTDAKSEIIATLESGVYFNEGDVIGIMNAVLENRQKEVPNYIKLMPEKYKSIFESMSDLEKQTLNLAAKSGVYKLNTPYQVKTFWDSQNFVSIEERVISENNQNIKLAASAKAINENQSTEGYVKIDDVLQNKRGYTNEYIESLKRDAARRK